MANAHLNAPGAHSELHDTADGRDLEEDTLRRLELSGALARLDDRERELLALRYGGGLSSREIGAFLELEPNAVDVALHRARARLKADLTDRSGETVRPTGSRSGAPAQS
jgi:RNA polymerase sigma factor (sigma-70 family)